MSGKPKDHRPRVISLRTSLDGLSIAAKQSILWPCHAFSISIPQKKKSCLNVFEETILKLTEIESGDTDKISEITCLEKELVSFIQNRLNQLILINDRYNLTQEGKKLLNSWRNNGEENIEYVAGIVFVDLLNGKLLPYVHIGDLKYESVLSIDGDFITVNSGSTGKVKNLRCRLIRLSGTSYRSFEPSPSDIIGAIKNFKKKYERYALLNQSFDQYPPPVPMTEAISVNKNPELVYLHCDVIIQEGNSDILVTNGCGFGFSEGFADYLTSQSWQWLTDLKKKGIIEKISSLDSNQKKLYSRRGFKYPAVTRLFKDPKYGVDLVLRELEKLPKTESEEKDYIEKRQKIASKLYEAIERSLVYIVADYQVSDWDNVFSKQSYEGNQKLLCGFAKKIGFFLSNGNIQLLQVKAGAIRQINNGKVKLPALLAIAIAGAATKYPQHPLHALAHNHSGFLDFSLKLKKLRDPVSHGDISDFTLDQSSLKGIIEHTKEIIITLIPSIFEELTNNEIPRSESLVDINQERLKANLILEEAFGMPFIKDMSCDLKEQLVRIELMLSQFSDDITMEILKCMTSGIQIVFHNALSERLPCNLEHGEIKIVALDNMVNTGFYKERDDIPSSISTVRLDMIKKSADGINSTLGADFLTFFAICSINELNRLYHKDSSIVSLIVELLDKRGDGNTIKYSLSQNDLRSLKNNVFKTIKMITEIF